MRITFGILLTGFFILRCAPSHTVDRAIGYPEIPQKLIQEISFNELYNRVLEPKCIGCHSGSARLNLETFANVKALAKRIEHAAITARTMPKLPFSPLDPGQLQLLAAWIQAGTPENPRNGRPAPAKTALGATFASIQAKILLPRCVACHSSDGSAWQVSLDTPADMIDSPLEIVMPGNPNESGLMIVIQEGARKKMPPLKGDISALSAEEIQTISQWIAQGAKD